MRVHSVCGYRSRSDEWTERWSEADYRARNLVKGLKREEFRGFSEWKVRATNQVLRLDSTPAGQALALRVATSKVLDLFTAHGISEGTLIPVPSSQTTRPHDGYPGARLARAISGLIPGLEAAPVLFFDAPQPKAHQGGARRWQDLLPHLRGDATDLKMPVVLIDDVMTTGGHLRACARYLMQKGYVVEDAFVVGRTVWSKPIAMFTMPTDNLTI